MKKEYSAPKLVNILAVGGGKAAIGTERISDIRTFITNKDVHLTKTSFPSNILHHKVSTKVHRKSTEKVSDAAGTYQGTIHFNTTAASMQTGPS